MFDWLFEMSDFWLIAVNIVVALFCFSAIPYLIYRVIRIEHKPDRCVMLLNAHTAIITCAGIVLAFALVEAGVTMHTIESQVSKEASEMVELDRLLTRWNRADATALRPVLTAYATSVITDEWPLLSEGRKSRRTTDLLKTLSRGVYGIHEESERGQTLLSKAFDLTDQISDLRDERVFLAQSGLPKAFWSVIHLQIALIFIISVALLVTGALYPSVENILGLGAHGVSILVLTALVFTVDRPFKGDISVAPDPIQRAIVAMAEPAR